MPGGGRICVYYHKHADGVPSTLIRAVRRLRLLRRIQRLLPVYVAALKCFDADARLQRSRGDGGLSCAHTVHSLSHARERRRRVAAQRYDHEALEAQHPIEELVARVAVHERDHLAQGAVRV